MSSRREKKVWYHSFMQREREIKESLRTLFGHEDFRPLQREAVEASLAGRDLVMVLPTGGGKSLCYQLPAVVKEGVTVVVSPLLALMVDQVRALKLQGIAAEMIGSMQTAAEISEVIGRLKRGELKLLYVAPERFAAPGFVEMLASLPLAGFVVDEAHCVSEWGHEFREDYRKLGLLKARFPHLGVTAFTATATGEVEEDIVRQLGLVDPLRLRGSVYRDNLTLRAEPRVGDGLAQLEIFLKGFAGESGIVYAFTRNQTETLAAKLEARGFRTVAYHAGMPAERRQAAYHAFVHDEVDVVVATVAFGMGIDKSNIRFVVHTSMPKTLENYYQEVGRAGRDGLPAETLLLYSAADYAQRASLLQDLPEGPYRQAAWLKLEKMLAYCRGEACRHAALADYFGESMAACGSRCDNCLDGARPRADITEEARKLLSAIYRTGQRFGKGHLIDVLRGAKNRKVLQFGHDALSVYGIGAAHERGYWEAVAERLAELGLIRRGEHGSLLLTSAGADVLKGGVRVGIRAERLQVARKRAKRAAPVEGLEYDKAIFDRLREVRKKLAERDGVPAYIVFGDRTLAQMAAKLPVDKDAMLAIGGVGEKKFERYGEAFIEAIEEMVHERM